MYSHSITYLSSASSYWHGQSAFSDTNLVDAGAADVGVSFLTLSWSRTTPAATREDRCTCTFAIAKDPGGKLWSTIIDADKATAEGIFDTWWGSMKTDVANQFTLSEYRWHDYHLSDTALGPADRVTARSVAGTFGATSRMPDQDAQTVTFTTASRRHWGRVYLPGVAQGRYDTTYGRFVTSQVDDAATFLHTAAASLHSASMDIVVCSKQHGGILEIATIQCDDVVDIQRRRRAKQAAYRKIFTS